MLLEELQAAWDRPGEVKFTTTGEEGWFGDVKAEVPPGHWAMGWRATRPVKMWFGREKTDAYGMYVVCADEPTDKDVFETLALIRENFEYTMEILDQPAWRRLWRRIVLRLPIRLRMLPLDLQSRLPLRLQLWIMDRGLVS